MSPASWSRRLRALCTRVGATHPATRKIAPAVRNDDFHGWEAGALWDEISSTLNFLPISNGCDGRDKKWEHGVATFYKPFTRATIRYFDQANAAEARKWLREAERSAAVTA